MTDALCLADLGSDPQTGDSIQVVGDEGPEQIYLKGDPRLMIDRVQDGRPTRMASGEYRSLASDAQRLAQRVERYRAGVVTPAQQRVQAALAGYRSNQVQLMTLFEARHAEVEVQRKLLTLQRDLAKVQAQLAFKPIPGGAR